MPLTITIELDPQNMSDDLVDAGARAMAGMSWIDHGVDRHWDQVPQDERDYWKRFMSAGLLGVAAECNRQNRNRR